MSVHSGTADPHGRTEILEADPGESAFGDQVRRGTQEVPSAFRLARLRRVGRPDAVETSIADSVMKISARCGLDNSVNHN